MNNPSTTPPNGGRGDLRILAACPMCQTSYHPLKTRVVAERNDAHVLFLECRQCSSAVVAVVTPSDDGWQSIGTVTDLTRDELVQSTDTAVTTDDVIELFDWLEQQQSVQLTLRREKEHLPV